jgi:hypothetical protein
MFSMQYMITFRRYVPLGRCKWLQETKSKTCLVYGRFLFPCLRILINIFCVLLKWIVKKPSCICSAMQQICRKMLKNSSTKRKISYHKFPSDCKQRRKWLINIGRDENKYFQVFLYIKPGSQFCRRFCVSDWKFVHKVENWM